MLEETYSKHFSVAFRYSINVNKKPTVKNENKNLERMEKSLKKVKEADPAKEFSMKVEKLKEEGLDLGKLYLDKKSEDVETNTVRTGMIDITRR